MTDSFDTGSFLIEEALLSNFDQTRQFNIAQFIVSLSFSESIYSPFLMGELVIADSLDLVANFRMRGEEILKMTYVDFFGNKMVNEFVVASIHSYVPAEQTNAVSYRLGLISPVQLMSATKDISKSFTGTLSDTMKLIYSNNLVDSIHYPNSPTELDAQETVGVQTIVIPSFSPIDAISFLSKRSFSVDNASSNFLFFENRNGHRVVTHEELLRQANVQSEERFDTKKIYTYDPALNIDIGNKAASMNNIQSITFPRVLNTMEDIYSGAMISDTPTIDILQKQFLSHPNSYRDNYDKELYKKFDKDSVFPHTDSFRDAYFNIDENLVSDRPIFIDTFRDSLYYELIIPHRLTTSYYLSSIMCEATVPGRNDLVAGDIIRLNIPQFDIDEKKKVNKALSGYWLVNGISHNMQNNAYSMNLILTKDTLRGEIDV